MLIPKDCLNEVWVGMPFQIGSEHGQGVFIWCRRTSIPGKGANGIYKERMIFVSTHAGQHFPMYIATLHLEILSDHCLLQSGCHQIYPAGIGPHSDIFTHCMKTFSAINQVMRKIYFMISISHVNQLFQLLKLTKFFMIHKF